MLESFQIVKAFLRPNKPKQMAYAWSQGEKEKKKKRLAKGKCAPTSINLSVSQLFRFKGSNYKMVGLRLGFNLKIIHYIILLK